MKHLPYIKQNVLGQRYIYVRVSNNTHNSEPRRPKTSQIQYQIQLHNKLTYVWKITVFAIVHL